MTAQPNSAPAAVAIRDNAQGTPVSPRWDISQERVFTETILNQRVNFALIFFGLVVAGGIQLRSDWRLQVAIFAFGFIVVFLLSLAIWRADHKLSLLFNELRKDPQHPYTFIDEKAGPSGSKRRYVSVGVPMLLNAALLGLATASCLGYVGPQSAPTLTTIDCKSGSVVEGGTVGGSAVQPSEIHAPQDAQSNRTDKN